MAAGLALPLVPWAARNWRTLHEVRSSRRATARCPANSRRSDSTAGPRRGCGASATSTTRCGSSTTKPFTIERSARHPRSIRRSERARVAALLDQYNDTLTLTREQDRAFAEIARERTARDPLRTYVKIPVLRSLALWFTPRIELLPYSGQLWPFATEWDEDREDLLVTLGFIAVNAIYLATGAGRGVDRARALRLGNPDRVHSAADDLHRVFCRDAGAALRSRMFSRCDRAWPRRRFRRRGAGEISGRRGGFQTRPRRRVGPQLSSTGSG